MDRLVFRSIVRWCALSIAIVACVASKPPTTSLRLVAGDDAPRWAHVTIDDEPIGSLDHVVRQGVALPPGKHRITIELEGYLPWDQEVDAGPDGGLVKLDVVLVRKPE
jgi:hypothetical protein